MPFSARCFHQRQPSTAVGTARTAATGRLAITPTVTVAAAAAPANAPLILESLSTSWRVLLMDRSLYTRRRGRNGSRGRENGPTPPRHDPRRSHRALPARPPLHRGALPAARARGHDPPVHARREPREM